MSDPLVFRWVDPGEPVDRVAFPERVTAAEILDSLLTVQDARDGSVAWEGKLEDLGGDS